MITDANGKPIQSDNVEQPADKAKEGNGADVGKRNLMDVRAMPTGTLVYNLIRVTCDEVGLENELNRMEIIMKQERMVSLPAMQQQMKDRMEQVHAQFVQNRYIMARELNQRFEEVDKARRDKFGIEVWEAPAEPLPDLPPEGEIETPSTEDVLASFGGAPAPATDDGTPATDEAGPENQVE